MFHLAKQCVDPKVAGTFFFFIFTLKFKKAAVRWQYREVIIWEVIIWGVIICFLLCGGAQDAPVSELGGVEIPGLNIVTEEENPNVKNMHTAN